MVFLRRAFFSLLTCALFVLSNADDPNLIRGIPGKDYPNYSTIPVTSFRCSEQHHIPGFYADPETRCQVFHFCFEHRRESFICPSGTIFNQAIQACDYWYSSECTETPLYYDTDSPNKVIVYDHESEFIPIKTSTDNLFDKMASLYQLKDNDHSSTDSGKYTDSFEEDLFFGDREHTSLTNIRDPKKIEDHLDRRDLVFDDYTGEHGQIQSKENVKDKNLKVEDFLEDSDQFSGESEGSEREIYHKDSYLVPWEEVNDIGNQQFSFENDGEESRKPHNSYEDTTHPDFSYYENESDDTESSGAFGFSTEGASMSQDKLFKRQLENANNRRKSRRKPIFTIYEHHETISTSESTEEFSKSSLNTAEETTMSAAEELESESKSSVISSQSKRRRKPVVIDLEDSLQYNIGNKGHSDDGTRTSSVNYDVYPHSQFPGISIAAHEISVKLLPNEIKRKPFNYLPNLDGISEERDFIDVTSPESNIYHETSTLPTLQDIEKNSADDLLSINIRPIRKKSQFRIIDSVDDTAVADNEEYTVTTTMQPINFEDEVSSHTTEKESQDFEDKFLSSKVYAEDVFEEATEIKGQTPFQDTFYKAYTVGMDPSEFVTGTDKENIDKFVTDSYNFEQFTPSSHFEMSHGINQIDFQQTYPEILLDMKQSENETKLEETEDSVNYRNLENLEFNAQEEMLDESHVTTEYFSGVSSNMPIEIHNTEDSESQYYFIPQSGFEPDYDYLDIIENTRSPVAADSEEEQGDKFLESRSFDMHPPLQSFYDGTKFAFAVTEQSVTEDIELQTILNEFHENDKEIEPIEAFKSIDNNSYSKKRITVASTPQSILDTDSESHEDDSVVTDAILDAEFQDYLSNFNANSDTTYVNDLLTVEPELKKSTEKHSLGNHYFVQDEAFDFDKVKGQDEDFEDRAVEMTYRNDNYEYQTDSLEKGDQDFEDHTVAVMSNWNENFENETSAIKENFRDVEGQTDAIIDWMENLENKTFTTEERVQNFEDKTNVVTDFNIFEDHTDAMKERVQDFDQIDSVTEWEEDLQTQSPTEDYLSENANFLKNNVHNTNHKISKSVVNKEDMSHIRNDDQVKSSENMANSKHSILPSPIQIRPNKAANKVPLRNARAFVSPYQTDFNIVALGSQYFPGFPSSILKLKQDNVQKFLPYSMHGLEDVAYFSRTGDLLDSPKISKLIEMGKNLLRSKKAKFRIFSRYVNSFKKD